MKRKLSVRGKSIIAQVFYALALVFVPLAMIMPKMLSPELVNIEMNGIEDYMKYFNMGTVMGLSYLIIFIGVVLILGKDAYMKNEKPLDKNLLVNYLFKFVAISYLLQTLASALVGRVFPSVSTSLNQTIFTNLIGGAPVLMGISTAVLGPVIEELIFRFAIFHCIKNKKTALIVSSLCFGLVHISLSLSDLFFIPVYCGMGYIMGKFYYDTNDLRYSTAIHIFNNSFEVLVALL